MPPEIKYEPSSSGTDSASPCFLLKAKHSPHRLVCPRVENPTQASAFLRTPLRLRLQPFNLLRALSHLCHHDLDQETFSSSLLKQIPRKTQLLSSRSTLEVWAPEQ